MEKMIRVGVITTTHGVKGEVKVFPTTDTPDRFVKGLKLTLSQNGKERPVTVEQVKFFKNLVILKFREITSCNEAETLRTAELLVPREEAIPLEEGEYLRADLLDLEVYRKDGSRLGVLTDILETGANDVYLVTMEDGKQQMIPNIPDCIKKIDLDANRMDVELLPGLEDL